MKTIPEYLSGQFDVELCVLVAEARGWQRIEVGEGYKPGILSGRLTDLAWRDPLPPFSTSLDACRELLVDLQRSQKHKMCQLIGAWINSTNNLEEDVLIATSRQICVAYLIVKNVLK